MTDMKRTTVSLPDELVASLDALKATEEFSRVSYSALIRIMIQRGLISYEKKSSAKSP